MFLEIFLILEILLVPIHGTKPSYQYCDDDAVHGSIKLSSLTPNQFLKICPATIPNKKFGQPRCGDGTNFAFFFSRPTQKLENDQKIIIEFQGGGACWDAESCSKMGGYLTFPDSYDEFMGLSRSEIDMALNGNAEQNQNEKFPQSILCTKTFGNTNLEEYNSIVVPYCTQDIHIGDNVASYFNNDDGEGGGDNDDDSSVIRHVGGHNSIQTLQWLFQNFPNPSHIILTGCSAGASSLAIIYDIIHKHYNSPLKFGLRTVQISILGDSPVYLTPASFLQNGFNNWNPRTILKRINFSLDHMEGSLDYSTNTWDHILKRGSNLDKWGVISHTYDPVALSYYEAMDGYYENDDDDSDDDVIDQFWKEYTNSLNFIQQKHANVQTYFIDGEGHCSFGLYYALQTDGFNDWASPIVRENFIIGKSRPSLKSFLCGLCLSLSILFGILYASQKRKPIQLQDVILLNNQMKTPSFLQTYMDSLTNFLLRFKSCPITITYAFMISFYFISMLIVGGITHPLNNPSLGPNAVTLSSFGINNPTLIVYNYENWRLLSSSFLCSGIITYTVAILCLRTYVRHFEAQLKDTKLFVVIFTLILLGSNLIYASVASGASCSSMAVVLGLNASSIALRNKISNCEDQNNIQVSWKMQIFLFIFVSLLFPFNSFIILISATAIGYFLTPMVVSDNDINSEDDTNVESRDDSIFQELPKVAWMTTNMILLSYGIIFVALLSHLVKPDIKYKYPLLTGCEMVYSTDVSDFVGNYIQSNNERYLEEDESMCAQLCVPHLIFRPMFWGSHQFTSFSIQHGLCEDNGYDVHVADKTFHEYTITLDVELYYKSEYED